MDTVRTILSIALANKATDLGESSSRRIIIVIALCGRCGEISQQKFVLAPRY